MHPWCSPSTGCSQSAGRLYNGVAVPLLSWLCVPGSQHHQLSLCVFCLGWKSGLSVWAFFLLDSFYTFWSVTPTSPLVYGSNVFCSSIILIELEGGQFIYILFPPWSVTQTSPLVFGSNVFCSFLSLIELVAGSGLYSQFAINLLWFVQCAVSSCPVTPVFQVLFSGEM